MGSSEILIVIIGSHYFDVNIQSLAKVPLLQRYVFLIVTVILFLDPAWASALF